MMISPKILMEALGVLLMKTSEMRTVSQKIQVRKRRPKKMALQVNMLATRESMPHKEMCPTGIKVDKTIITLIFKESLMKRPK